MNTHQQFAHNVARFAALVCGSQWAIALVAVQLLLATATAPLGLLADENVVTAQQIENSEALDQLLTSLVLEHLPHNYEDEKKWGGQTERWDGVRVYMHEGKLRTHGREKTVNHGTWKRYSAELMNPNEEFAIQVQNMRQLPNGKMAFDVRCQAHLKLHGRQAKWVKGVQLYSLSVDGEAKVDLALSMQLETLMDITKFPPDLVFKPKATDASIDVQDFRIHRVSKLGGEFAQQVTKGVRRKLDEKIAAKEEKLTEKINAQLHKKRDRLRLSISDAIKSKWTKPAAQFLPEPIQQALGSQ